ncbi:MAG: type II toxin-antitoxin system VapC family toxin [Chloroflexi bacterium]|nr:type II toxin-antitoxin system VapC family toxin [Chloroflexota bacterium]
MNYLLDTCVISELVAKRPDPNVLRWIDSIDEQSLYLNVITIGEIRKGIERLADEPKKLSLHDWLQSQLLVRFAGRVQGIDTEVMLIWGTLVSALEKAGTPMPALDSLIAAIAVKGDFTLVTRNQQDFQHSGATVFNPWQHTGA